MTADQLSVVIDAWVWVDQQAATYGPGVGLCAVVYIAWSIADRIRQRLRHAAHHIDTLLTPTDDTQPGNDDDLLADCWTAWKADTTRKEKP